MLPYRRAARLVSLAVLLMTSLTACANSPIGKTLEPIVAADPRLLGDSSKVTTSPSSAIAQLPADFPDEIPRYPNAQLVEVALATAQASDKSGDRLTRWVSSDPSNLIETFYQKQFQANNWEILSQPTDQQGGTFEVRRNNLQVSVSIQPQAASSTNSSATPSPNQLTAGQNLQVTPTATQFVIQYNRNIITTAQVTPAEAPTPQPGEPSFIGPVLPLDQPETNTLATNSESQVFTDLNKVPQALRQYVEDLVALDVLPLESSSSKSNQTATKTQFEPNKIISRRQYARWLVAANNKLHANSPNQQIRLASETAQPTFQDVPPRDPDFPSIQGLAEAGLIPSPLSGDSTAVLFRPDAPLTREQLILWKVRLDTRQALPNASVDAVTQTWGFQDAARIEPKALRAVLADFQNGDQSNIRRVFGYTTIFQPKKPVTRAEAAAALWYFGTQGEGVSAKEALQLKSPQSQPSATPVPTPK